MTPKQLAKQLRNVGEILAKKLIDAGIDTPEKLFDLGAENAFMQIHESGGFCGKYNAAYLFALEGAILDMDWLQIPEERKQAFKQMTQDLRERNQ